VSEAPEAELPFPRTELALDAIRFVRGIEDPAVVNHSMRTYLYGRLLGQQTQATWPTWQQMMTMSPSWHDYYGYSPQLDMPLAP
jgi:hypothetical protein